MSISSIPVPKAVVSPQTNGYAADYLQHSSGLSSSIQNATYQASLSSARLPNDSLNNISPDELFTKHTVLEIKGVQQRLRADADAKQEELRLMVGERYRDLLQASSSIIAIASSSRRVVEALGECREEISSQHALPTPPKTAALEGIDDSHLLILQVLSAHMKLLLDAPEHLWRLIERQKYLQAAWLFLLARVVHRALIQNDENEDQSWASEGVDILNEFPLVQRQWDVVSQFRSQIIHKSTLSLREASTSSEDICAILVTLHLLDSRPLSETLNALFQQRSKALQALLSWNSESNPANILPDQLPSVPAREVTQVMKSSLAVISQTVCAARNIFSAPGPSSSLIRLVLEKIQLEAEEDSDNVLPESLRISTQSLLTHLTSSANFQLLPPNLKYYKPYIDMDSPSTSLSQALLSKKSSDWFQNSLELWLQSTDRWISGLSSVKDVGALRNSVRRSIIASGLNESEKQLAMNNLNSLCNKTITRIWRTKLSNAELSCKARLRDMVFKDHTCDLTQDTSPVEYLFQPPPIPHLPQTFKSIVDTPFQKYQASLKRQLITRSTQLDTVISTLEQCAKNIQLDFSHLKATDDGDTMLILKELTQMYRPTATSVTTNILSFMDETASDAIKDSNPRPDGLAFISRVTYDLAHSSSFIDNIGCSVDIIRDFKNNMISINEKVVQKWSQIMMDFITRKYKPRQAMLPIQAPGGPSPQILQALLMVCESIQQLGLFHYPTKQHSVAKEVLCSLIHLWLDDGWGSGEQVLHDRSFLKKICDQYGESLLDISNLLTDKLKSSAKDDTFLSDLDSSAGDYLSRTQTLLAVLLPPSPPAFDMPLLQFGNPSTGQSHQSPVDVAKPSPRFGMLLVANTQH